MKRIRGFKLKHRVGTLFRFDLRRNRTPSGYHRLDSPTCKAKPISRLFSCLKTKAKSFCSSKPFRGYVPLDDDLHLVKDKAVAVAVPKGHIAVYVCQKDGEFQRFLVPVIHFNHPLFGKLLREAEEEFGFNQEGGITIPCRISEFESVQTRIAAARGGRKFLTRKKAP